MARAGQIPFICSFSCFVVGRFEQIRMAIAYNRANVTIVGTHAGIGIGEDGYSQMATEDVALMRDIAGVRAAAEDYDKNAPLDEFGKINHFPAIAEAFARCGDNDNKPF